MAIDFACSCGKRLRAREDMAGKQGRCKACGSVHTIPKAARRPVSQVPASAINAAPPPQVMTLSDMDVVDTAMTLNESDVIDNGVMPGVPWQQPHPAGLPSWLVPAVAIGGVLVLGGIGVAIALSGSRRNDTPVAAANNTEPAKSSAPSRSPAPMVDRPREPANWSSDNLPANSANPSPSPGKPPAESPAWGSEIADTAAPRDPWIHPAMPAGYTPKVQIPIQGINADQVLYAQQAASFAIIGTDCWNITTGVKVGAIGHEMQRGSNRVRCLSADGTLFAEVVNDTNVEIWSCDNGEKLTTLNLTAQSSLGVKFVAFLASDRLLTANTDPFKSWIQIWDLANDFKQVKDFDAKRIGQPHEATLSSDGKHLAIIEDAQILVYETEKGKLVAQMEQPAKSSGLPPLHLVSSLKFSPDGTELAAAAEHGARLICWNSRAKIVLDKPLVQMGVPDSTRAANADDLQWLPDASGWLIGGRWLLLKEPQRVVWQLGDKWHHQSDHTRILDQNHLLVKMGGGKDERLVSIPIPWTRLNASLTAMKEGAPALIRPSQGVSIQVKLGEVRFADAEQARQALEKATQEKLQQSGVRVGDGQAILLVYYQEKAGDQVSVYQRNNRYDFRGQDTGQRVQDTRGELQLSLWESGAKEPLWKTTLQARSSGTYTDAITEKTVRDSMFASALAQLKSQFFPYFLPKDQGQLSLPALTSF